MISRSRARRATILAICLAAAVALSPGNARANFAGSLHDFAAGPHPNSLAATGACSACHIPHGGESDSLIWSRSLAEEKSYFNQLATPNYAPGFSILCYDCHDNHASSSISGVDNDPADAVFGGRIPQDVAFDDDMKSTVPRDGSNATQTPPRPGYYENVPSGTSGGGSTYVSGHFFLNSPGGTGGFAQGDKLPCSDCHDPHKADNQAFIRPDLGGKSLTGKKASTNMAYDPLTRDDQESRDFCIACHGTENQATSPAVKFNDINPLYGSAKIVWPPAIIPAHQASSVTACTDCHKHNAIKVSCTDCHGFPPLAGDEDYPGGGGAHQRHKDALGDAIFACGLCHGPDAGAASWHNEGAGAIPDGSNVDIMGLTSYWNPSPGGRSPAYNGVTAGSPPAGYSFRTKGGGEQRCSGVACHGNAPAAGTPYLKWTDDMVDEATGAWIGNGASICKWCHSGTPDRPATIDGGATYAPNVVGNGLATAAGFGAEVNGHGVGLPGALKAAYDDTAVNDGLGSAGAAKDCVFCHDARYEVNPTPPPANRPVKTHFTAAFEKRLWSGVTHQINGQTISAVATSAPDELCVACHLNTGAAAGTQVSHHGNTSVNYTPLEPPPFKRVCRQCHNVHGANWNGAGRNLYMVGKWLDADSDGTGDVGEGAYVDSNATDANANITAADNAVVFTSFTGADSFDEGSGAYNAAEDADDICGTCHNNATRGGDHSGTTGMNDERGNNCMACHDHDYSNEVILYPDDAFLPGGCEGCHGKNGVVHRGLDGIPNTADDAPNMMTVDVSGTWVSVWDGTWWDTQMGGGNAYQQGGHGDPDGKEGGVATATPACTACHDTGDPSPSTHLDGVYNSLGTEHRVPSNPSTPRPKGNMNSNTSHLKTLYYTQFDPGSGPSRIQVAMDDYCTTVCHAQGAINVPEMRHEKDGNPVNSVALGTHGTITAIPFPKAEEIRAGGGDFAPCVSCHDPHGTTVDEYNGTADRNSNKMIRGSWKKSTLCKVCHL